MTNIQPSRAQALAADPIFLEVFWTRIRSVVNEAAKLIVRTSFSTLSTEANDFAVVVTDSAGRALAENVGSIPSFIGTLPRTVQATLVRIGKENMRPGDIFITNNPWIGTGHLNDVCLVKPIFHDDVVIAFAATAGHVPDIGGRIRSTGSRELFEEGLHIPLGRLLTSDGVDETLLSLIRANVRTPEQTVGDIWSQVGAVELISDRINLILPEYGLSGINDLANALFERSDSAMEQAILGLREGTYAYEMETDGFGDRLRYALTVTIGNGRIDCDFAGTSPQQPRGINCVLAYTNAMTAYAIKCLLLPDLPNNDGLFRRIGVRAPEGSLLNPMSPAPVAGRACTGHYVPSVVFGAMYQVIPEKVMAGVGSPLWIANLSGTRSNGKPFATVLFFNGGMGGTAAKDGASVMSWPSNISATPIEVAERDGPIFFKRKALITNSGGAGKFRGGLGEEIVFTSRHHAPLNIVFLTERIHVPAPGLGGGSSGARGEVLINGMHVDSREPHILKPGDEVTLRTPGGGGYGIPTERFTSLSDRDRQLQYVDSAI